MKTENIIIKSFLNVWIVPYDPFLNKKWLKSEVCGTHEQCTDALFTGEKSNVVAWKKKEKNEMWF